MTTKTFCNKCKVIKRESENWLEVKTNKGTIDLCEECSKSFKEEYDL